MNTENGSKQIVWSNNDKIFHDHPVQSEQMKATSRHIYIRKKTANETNR